MEDGNQEISFGEYVSENKKKLILLASAFLVLVAGYVCVSNREAQYSGKVKPTLETSSPENPDYNANYIIVNEDGNDVMYVKPMGYESYHIEGMNAVGYKYDENGDIVADTVPLVPVVRTDEPKVKVIVPMSTKSN